LHNEYAPILIRPGYPLDFKKTLKKGVMISINPDAHSIKEIDNIKMDCISST